MTREYAEIRNGGYYVAGSRVSLDSLVYLYREGASAEDIQDDFPSLSLEQIHGAIAFYLAHQNEVDENIAEGERDSDRLVAPLETSRPELYARLQRVRQQLKR
jgi:uncharacterized protein (DUF433 family)